MGAKMQPCLTQEVVEILDDSFCPTPIRTPVFSGVLKGIRWSMTLGIPLLRSAFQRAVQSTESKADNVQECNVQWSVKFTM